ncbi:hypothetical protein tb265_21690 [Gemmatimonadetes bacterium T265]|nr:hypothetical protein tb265_21690 [Gemmatimonadetes bacterium T265]
MHPGFQLPAPFAAIRGVVMSAASAPFDSSDPSRGSSPDAPTRLSTSTHGDAEVPLARAAQPADAPAAETPTAGAPLPRRIVQSGIQRRRALAADARARGSAAHVELPVVRPSMGLLAAVTSRREDLAPAPDAFGTAPGRTARADVALARAITTDAPADRLATFANRVAGLLFVAPLDEVLAERPSLEGEVLDEARRLAARAYPAERVSDRSTDRWVDHAARDEFHRALLACYQPHVRLPHHGTSENQFHPFAVRLLRVLEGAWERDLLARARRSAQRALGDALTEAELPADPEAFCEWFKRAAFTHPLYEHPLHGFLSGEATREQLEHFLRLESAGEAAFDDLVALGQLGTRGEVKIEMGRNYWDELGNGKSHAVHTHLFHHLTETLEITAPEAHELPWQVLGGVNVMLWSCIPRRNAFRAQGTLGAVELLAPQRCTRLVTGAQRVGIPKKAMAYYAAHAIIDVGHAEGWLDHVIRPQVAELPAARVGIAEGLMARADASLDYFDYASGLLRA